MLTSGESNALDHGAKCGQFPKDRYKYHHEIEPCTYISKPQMLPHLTYLTRSDETQNKLNLVSKCTKCLRQTRPTTTITQQQDYCRFLSFYFANSVIMMRHIVNTLSIIILCCHQLLSPLANCAEILWSKCIVLKCRPRPSNWAREPICTMR